MVFRGDVGDIALIGSIFNVLGTPTTETWPVRTQCTPVDRLLTYRYTGKQAYA